MFASPNADVKEIGNTLQPLDFLWATGSNMPLKSLAGHFTSQTKNIDLAGKSNTASVWMLNWEARGIPTNLKPQTKPEIGLELLRKAIQRGSLHFQW